MPAALNFIEEHIGGRATLMEHNHQLICALRDQMIEHWWPNTTELKPAADLLGAMLTLPLPPRITRGCPSVQTPYEFPAGTIHPLQNALYNRGFEVPIITWRNGLSNNGEPTMLI